MGRGNSLTPLVVLTEFALPTQSIIGTLSQLSHPVPIDFMTFCRQFLGFSKVSMVAF